MLGALLPSRTSQRRTDDLGMDVIDMGSLKQAMEQGKKGGERQGTLTAAISHEVSNVAIDAWRWWAAHTPDAASSSRVPWLEITAAVFGSSEVTRTTLILRITIRGAAVLRGRGFVVCNRLFTSLSPLEKVDVFGGPCAVVPLLDGVDVKTFLDEAFFGEVADDSDDGVALTAWEYLRVRRAATPTSMPMSTLSPHAIRAVSWRSGP